jgi:hypothetical protein
MFYKLVLENIIIDLSDKGKKITCHKLFLLNAWQGFTNDYIIIILNPTWNMQIINQASLFLKLQF